MKCQQRMEQRLKTGSTDMGICSISFRPETVEEQVYWLKGKEVWAAFGDGGNRFWNAFGLGNPATDKELTITVELNPPKSGINRRMAGAFAKDPLSGPSYLVHRGNMGGGKPGIGKYGFLAECPQLPVNLYDEGQGESPAIVVGMLDDPSFAISVTDFVKSVDTIKKKLSGESEAPPGMPVLPKHSPEFEGPQKPYKIDAVIQARRTHGEVVNALVNRINPYGTCSNVKTPDGNRPDILFAFQDKRRGSALFEVKTDTSPASIYTAIGQLKYYSQLYKPHPRHLVAVFPHSLTADRRHRLEAIGLEVVTFEKAGKALKFKGLQVLL